MDPEPEVLVVIETPIPEEFEKDFKTEWWDPSLLNKDKETFDKLYIK